MCQFENFIDIKKLICEKYDDVSQINWFGAQENIFCKNWNFVCQFENFIDFKKLIFEKYYVLQ